MTMTMAFDPCRFAECLAKYEAIWNVKAKDHGNKDKRKAQLQALANECGISVELAETKYTSLRTYFVKQRRKVKESQRNGYGIGDIYRPSWPPYSSLTFLEKTLDIQGNQDLLGDDSMRISMVDRVPRYDLTGPITMVDLSSTSIPDTRSPDGSPTSLSMPENSRSPTPNSSVSPGPRDNIMRSPIPEGLQTPIKVEAKDGEDDTLLDFAAAPRSMTSPTATSPVSCATSPITSYLSPVSSFPSLATSYNQQRARDSRYNPFASNTPISSNSIVLSSYPITFPHPIQPPHPGTRSAPHMGKSRKRVAARQEDIHLGVILQDAVDNLRAITNARQDDPNDDVSGFLKMIAYQLRSIEDPIRRMRLMHDIQGLVVNEIATVRSSKDEAAQQKCSPTPMVTLEFSTS